MLVPALIFATWFAAICVYVLATNRRFGLGGCMVCDRAPVCEMKEKTELQVLFPKLWNNQVLARMPGHGKAWRAHRWRPDNCAARTR
ncbi:hypothetical protein [Pseudoclavibacter sp. RFBA6]|uniref:hypothetical protein n=1 Tax=Pseudoclavibacter sp. RFBA6 TaxID=2080573 RepID=UPI000CE82198|nr:hypothetical protein [Pseudoclavibacter sp. RFBA6]PPG39289.1 hypothetical protein C5C17_10805 [Pseudoclavibacter sp. RFBA6]